MAIQLPPFPTGDLREWARQITAYLTDQFAANDVITNPKPVLLQHKLGTSEKAVVDGLLMFDPAQQRPTYSFNKQWELFSNANDLADYVLKTGDTMTGDLFLTGGSVDIYDNNFPALRISNSASVVAAYGWSIFHHPTVYSSVDNLRFEYWTNSTTYGGLGLSVGWGGISVTRDVQMTAPVTTGAAANIHMDANGFMRKVTSSGKYKTNKRPIKSDDANISGPVIDALNPVIFTSTHDIDEGRDFVGFIAEEVIAAIPQADANDNYDIRAVVAYLTAEVKHLRKRVAKLERSPNQVNEVRQ